MSRENDKNFDEEIVRALWEFYEDNLEPNGVCKAWGKKEQKIVLKLVKSCRDALREEKTFNRYNFLTEIILTFEIEKFCNIYNWNNDYVVPFLSTLALTIEKYY